MENGQPPEVSMVEQTKKPLTVADAQQFYKMGIDVVRDADAKRRKGIVAILVSKLRAIRTGNLFLKPQEPKAAPPKK